MRGVLRTLTTALSAVITFKVTGSMILGATILSFAMLIGIIMYLGNKKEKERLEEKRRREEEIMDEIKWEYLQKKEEEFQKELEKRMKREEEFKEELKRRMLNKA